MHVFFYLDCIFGRSALDIRRTIKVQWIVAGITYTQRPHGSVGDTGRSACKLNTISGLVSALCAVFVYNKSRVSRKTKQNMRSADFIARVLGILNTFSCSERAESRNIY